MAKGKEQKKPKKPAVKPIAANPSKKDQAHDKRSQG